MKELEMEGTAMLKWADFYTTDGKYIGKTKPKGEKAVIFDPSKHKYPVAKSDSLVDTSNVVPLSIAIGSGLLGHTVASSLFDDDDDRKKDRSLWEKVLSNLAPIGAGGLSAYLGYLAGQKLNKKADVVDMDKSKEYYDSTPWWRWIGAGVTGAGALGSEAGALNLGWKWLNSDKKIAPGEDITAPIDQEIGFLKEKRTNAQSAEQKYQNDLKRWEEQNYADKVQRARASADAQEKTDKANLTHDYHQLDTVERRIREVSTSLRNETDPKKIRAIESELKTLNSLKKSIVEHTVPQPPQYPNFPSMPTKPNIGDIGEIERKIMDLTRQRSAKVPNPARANYGRWAKRLGKLGIPLAVLSFLFGRSAVRHQRTGDKLNDSLD